MREKVTQRQSLLQKRREIVDRPRQNRIIFEKLLTLKEFQTADCVLTYVSNEYEVDTMTIIGHCLINGIKVAIPGIVVEKLDGNDVERMKFFTLTEKWVIAEEIACCNSAVCLVPGLAFNAQGYRLGYGGGYYDRFLKTFNGTKIGLCFKELYNIKFPVEEHDEKVDIIVNS